MRSIRQKQTSCAPQRTITGEPVRLAGTGLAVPYAVALGLVVAAALGLWAVVLYAVVVGPCAGWVWHRRTAA